MDARSFIAKLVLRVFALAALLGVFGMVSLSHAEHGGCPSSPVQHSLCATPLEHLGHWQDVFTAVFAEFLVLLSLAIAFVLSVATLNPALAALPTRTRSVPYRPTFLQELFSKGILHRKEPQIA